MDTQWRHISKKYENLGRCGRQNMLRPYLKIWDWEWIFGPAVLAISSLGIRSLLLLLTPYFLFCLPWGQLRLLFFSKKLIQTIINNIFYNIHLVGARHTAALNFKSTPYGRGIISPYSLFPSALRTIEAAVLLHLQGIPSSSRHPRKCFCYSPRVAAYQFRRNF